MRSNTKYKNINNLNDLLKVFYYATFLLCFIGTVTILATLLLPDTAITFERGIHEWFYSINLPIGIGSMAFTVQSSIPSTILHLIPIEMINIKAAIIIDSFIGAILLIVLINIGLKKLTNLTKDILNKESPFQLKHIKSLRKFSFVIILYSTVGNTVVCVLFSIFVTGFMNITFDFMWSGIFIGILGYIFSDITEYGLFLQDEYDTTL